MRRLGFWETERGGWRRLVWGILWGGGGEGEGVGVGDKREKGRGEGYGFLCRMRAFFLLLYVCLFW